MSVCKASVFWNRLRSGWRRPLAIALLAAAPLAAGSTQQSAVPDKLVEPPYFQEQVASGKLPPVEQRVPDPPAVASLDGPGQSIGKYGGELTMLMASPKDTRIMVVYGYARLVSYTPDLKLMPDILESYDVQEGRIFTFKLRKNHKWSDGQPFTTEDFRYFWEDVTQNTDLSPTGADILMMVDGELPKVEFLDELTVRYTWSQPNLRFLPALAGASPLYIYRPSHYLKQFHAKYADPAKLQQMVEESGQPSWAALHNRKDNMYRNDNPELPTLDPWVLKTEPPSERFIFERNPYYHRVDPEGRQLPYIDRVAFAIADSKLIPAKAGAGEADLQARNIRFDNYTFLKEGESRGKYHVRLWDNGNGNALALFPNLNVNDPAWRQLLRDVRFRRALSLGIDRDEINQVIYFGLAVPAANTVLEQSPLFKPEYQGAWTQYDPDLANRLLDEIGLTKRNGEGIRLLPDGRPLQIVIETMGQAAEETDVLQLIREQWRKIGIDLFTKPSERDVVRQRIFAGDTIMSVWTGLENAIPTADTMPVELAPTTQQQLQWPKWGQYLETKGKDGEPVDLPEAKELASLLEQWGKAATPEEKAEIWDKMLQIYTDQVYSIGTVAGVPQPVVVGDALRNVPEQAVYSWDPGAHFGMYKPDTFWLDRGT